MSRLNRLYQEGMIKQILKLSVGAVKFAQRVGALDLERDYRNIFENVARSLEEAEDISLGFIARPYRLAMEEFN